MSGRGQTPPPRIFEYRVLKRLAGTSNDCRDDFRATLYALSLEEFEHPSSSTAFVILRLIYRQIDAVYGALKRGPCIRKPCATKI